MSKSPEAMLESMISNMKLKTGKSLPEWLAIVKSSDQEKHGQIVKFLKSEHGMTHGFANLVANQHLKPVASSGVDLVETQYGGSKANLRPIYEKIIEYVNSLGSDVEISPKKANVSLRRSKQFALVQPSTKTRVDLGINLKGVSPNRNLEASGSFNSMVTHRVRLTSATEFDKDVKAWLKKAYLDA